MDTLVKDDVFLGDKGFISYFDMSHLKTKGVDSVIGLAKRPPVSVENAKRVIADNDLIVEWSKPKGSKTRYQLNEWNGLPDTLLVRQIKVTIEQAGFRVKSLHIATTLLDDVRYPANTIAELYLKRWNVELYFREIKTTLGLDILRCKSPDMILKEVLMYLIVFNAMRLLINDNRKEILEPDEMSFNSCRQVLNTFAMRESNKSFYESVKKKSNANIMNVLKECKLLKRISRFEPLVQKQRLIPRALGTLLRKSRESIRYRSEELLLLLEK